MSTKTSKENKQKRGVGVYIQDLNGLLLLTQRGPEARHEPYCWEAPGGALEDGESYEEAVDRELKEEIGVSVDLTQLVYETKSVIDAHGISWEARVYLATTKDSPSIQEPRKMVGFGWFSLDEMEKLNLATYSRGDAEKIRNLLR